MKFLKAFGLFWYDFIIGDDWKVAVYTVLALLVVALLAINGSLSDGAIAFVGVAVLCVFFVLGVSYDARKSSK